MYRTSFLRSLYFPQIVNLGSFVFIKKKLFYLNLIAGRGRPAKTEKGHISFRT